jgi:hypothetical protein
VLVTRVRVAEVGVRDSGPHQFEEVRTAGRPDDTHAFLRSPCLNRAARIEGRRGLAAVPSRVGGNSDYGSDTARVRGLPCLPDEVVLARP